MFNLDKKASSDLNLEKSSRQIEYPLFGSIGTKYSLKEEIHLLEPLNNTKNQLVPFNEFSCSLILSVSSLVNVVSAPIYKIVEEKDA